jgi:hypothetical protein
MSAGKEYCGAMFDLEIAMMFDSLSTHEEAGLQGMVEYRARWPHSNEFCVHHTFVICMSHHAKYHRVARRALRAGADDIVVKPFIENDEPLVETARRWLRATGREDHARCADVNALARGRPPSTPPRLPTEPPPSADATPALSDLHNHLAITGKPGKRGRVEILVNGRLSTMPSFGLFCLLKLVETRLRGAATATAKELGARDETFRGPSEMQKELKPYLLEGTSSYRTVRGVGYALDESVVVDEVDVEALAKHDEKRIRDVAARLAKLRPLSR